MTESSVAAEDNQEDILEAASSEHGEIEEPDRSDVRNPEQIIPIPSRTELEPDIPYSEPNSEPKGQVVGLLEENRRLRNQVKSLRARLAVKRNGLKSLKKQGKQSCSNFENIEMYPTKEIYFRTDYKL